MQVTRGIFQGGARPVHTFFNHHKENIKNITGLVTFTLGAMEFYRSCRPLYDYYVSLPRIEGKRREEKEFPSSSKGDSSLSSLRSSLDFFKTKSQGESSSLVQDAEPIARQSLCSILSEMVCNIVRNLAKKVAAFFNTLTFEKCWSGVKSGLTMLKNGVKALAEGTSKCMRTQKAYKMSELSGRFSLILSGAVSRPGVFLISAFAHVVASTSTLERVFGVNTTFAKNARHPRHVVSLMAVGLSTASMLHSVFYRAQPTDLLAKNVFNTFTSRPFFHLANYIVGKIVRG